MLVGTRGSGILAYSVATFSSPGRAAMAELRRAAVALHFSHPKRRVVRRRDLLAFRCPLQTQFGGIGNGLEKRGTKRFLYCSSGGRLISTVPGA